MKTKYNQEEQNLIKRAFEKVLDDLNLMFEHSEAEEIRVHIKYDHELEDVFPSSYFLAINKREISVVYAALSPEKVIPLELTSGRRGKKIRPYTLESAELILQEYEKIRPKVKNAIEKSIKQKQEKLAIFRKLDDKYSKEATIELDLPKTMNPHSIDLKQEDGKTIGEIKMGYGAIRIITNGPIIVNKSEQSKVKKKINKGV